jgi:hypothetical protein
MPLVTDTPGRLGGMYLEGVSLVGGAISNLSRTSKNAYFMGGLFDIFGAFLNIWVSLDQFLGLIFLFLSFFASSATVYTHRGGDHVLLVIGDTTLGITSVRTVLSKIHFGNIREFRLHTFHPILHSAELEQFHATWG